MPNKRAVVPIGGSVLDAHNAARKNAPVVTSRASIQRASTTVVQVAGASTGGVASSSAVNLSQQTPAALTAGDTGSPGTGGEASAYDHVHALAAGNGGAPPAIASAGSDGVSGNVARADHTHALGGTVGGDLTGTLPNPNLAAVGSATTKGTAARSATVTTDTKGRVTSLTDQLIGIDASQVTSGGYSGTITTAKLTAGGANGSMTFTNGVLTSQVAAT